MRAVETGSIRTLKTKATKAMEPLHPRISISFVSGDRNGLPWRPKTAVKMTSPPKNR